MLGFVHNMRKKNAHQKARFACIVSISITLLIAGVWLFTIPVRLASTGERAVDPSSEENLGNFINTTKSNVNDIVRTAEVLRNQGLAGAALPSTTTPHVTPETPPTTTEEALPLAIPRRVLIATTTDEMPE